MTSSNYQNRQSQKVRARLKNHLNVQLTDSNIVYQNIQGQFQIENIQKSNSFLKDYLGAQIFDSFQEQNNSDNSLIYQLGLLDKTAKQKNIIAQSSYLAKTQSKYFKSNEYTPSSRNKQVSPITKHNPISKAKQLSPIQKNKQSHYFRVKQSDLLKNRIYPQSRMPKKILSRQQMKLQLMNSSTLFQQQESEKNKLFLDIEQKISMIPSSIQNKIKNSLYNTVKLNNANIKSAQFHNLNHNHNHNQNQNYSNKPNQNQFIQKKYSHNNHEEYILQDQPNFKQSLIPIEQRINLLYEKSHLKNKEQKFVSHNREKFHKNQSIRMFQYQQRKISKSPIQYEALNNNQVNAIKLQTKFKNTRQQERIKSIQKKIQKRSAQNISMSRQKQLSRNKNKCDFNQNIKKVNTKSSKTEAYQYKLQQQFNRSKVVKNYHKIIDSATKCQRCHKPYGAITITLQSQQKKVVLSCNQCDLKDKLCIAVSFNEKVNQNTNIKKNIFEEKTEQTRQTQQIQFKNHPLVGVFYDLQNKNFSQEDQQILASLMQNLDIQIQKLNQMKKNLQNLKFNMVQIKNKMRKNTKQIFQVKNLIKKLTAEMNFNNCDQNCKVQQISKLIPFQYLEELNIWYHIKSKQYTKWPTINQSIQMLCPLYLKNIQQNQASNEQLKILTHNFEQIQVKISVNQGIPIQLKSFDCATFIVDGSYNIPVFQHIRSLKLQFHNKRTFRQISSVMQNLPISVQQIILKYNHKLNSHISAQKYPLLTKVCSLRMCKYLSAQIQNCKDQDDLQGAMKAMTKKKQITLKITRNLYVRNKVTDGTQLFIQMFKKLGKGIIKAYFKLPFSINEDKLFNFLIINAHPRLIDFSLQSQKLDEQQVKSHYQPNSKQENNLLSIISMLNQHQGEEQTNKGIYKQNGIKSAKCKLIFIQKLKLKTICLKILKKAGQNESNALDSCLRKNTGLMKDVLEMLF